MHEQQLRACGPPAAAEESPPRPSGRHLPLATPAPSCRPATAPPHPARKTSGGELCCESGEQLGISLRPKRGYEADHCEALQHLLLLKSAVANIAARRQWQGDTTEHIGLQSIRIRVAALMPCCGTTSGEVK